MAMTKLFASLFVVAMVAAMATPMVQAQGGGLLGGLINIQGTVFCTVDGNIAAPVFPNATVQLQCGTQTIVSTAITNGSGVFSILLDPTQILLSTLLNNYNLVVNTPLANCNATLPSVGALVSPLRFVSNTVAGLLNVVNIVPDAFQFVAGALFLGALVAP